LIREEIIQFPPDSRVDAKKFFEMAGMSSVAACLDGTHVPIVAPKNDKASYVNRFVLFGTTF
jgi:hypothetical protein